MCTLAISYYPQTTNPLIVAANRDEDPTRPCEDWKLRQLDINNNFLGTVPAIYSPLDVRKGTWIGINSCGIFSAVTNWDMYLNLKGMKSRGEIVYETLKRSNKESIIGYWNGIKAKEHKPFNILAGGKDFLLHLSCNHESISVAELGPGLHISTGKGFNKKCVRDDYIMAQLRRKFKDFSQPINPFNLGKLMGDHNNGKGSDDSVCVHDKEHKWETRSSSLLILTMNTWFAYHTNLPPCETEINKNGWINPEKWSTKTLDLFHEGLI